MSRQPPIGPAPVPLEHRRGPLVVVGDSFLDVDVHGSSTRLCPDAPVPVVDLERRWHRPGGAGLAALLAARTGVEVVLITALGADADGEALRGLWPGITVLSLSLRGRTVTKTRVSAADVPLLRLDAGEGRAAHLPLPPGVVRALAAAGAVLVSDYGRGMTALPELRDELAATARRVPVIWDPHPRGQPPVPGCRVVTPNSAEVTMFSRTDEQGRRSPGLRGSWRAEAVAVTTGPRGAILSEATPRRTTVIPVPADPSGSGRPTGSGERIDTCGAGDQFAAAAAVALLAGADTMTAIRAAVASATEFVRAGAASVVSTPVPGLDGDDPVRRGLGRAEDGRDDAYALADRVKRAGGRLVATGGCFDLLHRGHVELLEAARAHGDALVVCLNSDASVRRAKGAERPLVGQVDRARVLAALGAVDAVLVFDEDTPAAVLDRLRPDVWVKGADYADRPIPEAECVERHGGRVVLLPVVSGYSTTSLVRTARSLSPPTTADPVPLEVS
ncbi:MAG TPA: PfkB family carbohydrate kinase [Microlunatus sp.]